MGSEHQPVLLGMSLYVSVGLGLVLEGSVGGWGGGGLVVGGGGGGGGDDGGVIYGSSMSVITPSPALLCAALNILHRTITPHYSWFIQCHHKT